MLPGLPEKVYLKHLLELKQLHERCIKSYLVSRGVKYSTRIKFFKLYSLSVSEKNINHYWNIPIWLFVQKLVTDDLKSLFYKGAIPNVRTYRKKSIHRKK
jgi:hypothetical protein